MAEKGCFLYIGSWREDKTHRERERETPVGGRICHQHLPGTQVEKDGRFLLCLLNEKFESVGGRQIELKVR